MSTTTMGSSVMTASASASCLRMKPGPLDTVTPRCPANAAPMAELTAAISSSAWKVFTPKFLWRETSWRTSLAGVIG